MATKVFKKSGESDKLTSIAHFNSFFFFSDISNTFWWFRSSFISAVLVCVRYTLFHLSLCLLAIIATIASAEFKRILGLKRGNEDHLTYRQKNSVFFTIFELSGVLGNLDLDFEIRISDFPVEHKI